jgi:hypothetical protein
VNPDLYLKEIGPAQELKQLRGHRKTHDTGNGEATTTAVQE